MECRIQWRRKLFQSGGQIEDRRSENRVRIFVFLELEMACFGGLVDFVLPIASAGVAVTNFKYLSDDFTSSKCSECRRENQCIPFAN